MSLHVRWGAFSLSNQIGRQVDLFKQQYLVSKTLCEGVRISKINSDLLMEVIDGGNCNSVEWLVHCRHSLLLPEVQSNFHVPRYEKVDKDWDFSEML